MGAGFGGLWTAKALGDAPADVTLIDRGNYHTFFPLLYQVGAAELEPLMVRLFKELSDKTVLWETFPRIAYLDALDWYGSDKPDLRFDIELTADRMVLRARR